MNILVIGKRGIGLEIIKQGLEHGHNIRVLARAPESLKVTGSKLSFYRGDAVNPDDVNEAAKGMDVIISAMGVAPTNKEVNAFSTAGANIIKSVKNNGVKLFISVTGIGAGDSNCHGGFFYDRFINPLLLGKIYADKDRHELQLKQSDINWIIVRPGFLTNGPLTQHYRVLTDMTGVKCKSISRADCAHFILSQAASRTYIKQTPLITY